VERRSALSIIHDKRPVHTFFSSRGDTIRRSQHIKKLHRMLPTLTIMQARLRDLYSDNLCCLCRGALEDNNLVWVCPESFKHQKRIWEDAVALIPKWGRAIKKANEDATLQVQQAKSSGTRHSSPKDTLLAPTRGLASVGVTLLCFNDLSTYRPVRNGDEDTPHLDSARSVVTACQACYTSC